SMHDGLEAIRLIMRAGWRPPVVRLYDGVETARLFSDVSTGSNCLLILLSEGPAALTAAETAACASVCAVHGGHAVGDGPALRWHGTIAHHHGIGRLRTRWMERELGGGLAVLRALKQALDPKGIMNPGVLIP